ncbi:MAG: ribosome maturation factor RimM [Myxococcaceae bacterium]
MTTPHLQVGYVAKAHGLRGEVTVRTFDAASTALLEVDRVFVRTRDGAEQLLTIESARPAAKDLLIAFEEILDRSAAEGLVGATLFVFRDDLEPPGEGEYFQGDLLGLEAFTEEGEPVGRVEELQDLGEVPNLVIRKGSEELILPFVEAFVPEVDLEKGRITIRRPEYLE